MKPLEPDMNEWPPDPTIDEIRAIRKRNSAQFGHDPARLIDHLKTLQLLPELRERLLKSESLPLIEETAA